MADGSNGYQPPEIGGLDGDNGDGISTYGVEWLWETHYLAYVNGVFIQDTVFLSMNI